MASNSKKNEEAFWGWLAKTVSPKKLSDYYSALSCIDEFCVRTFVVKESIYRSFDKNTIDKIRTTVSSNSLFRREYRKQIRNCDAAIILLGQYAKDIGYISDASSNENDKQSESTTQTHMAEDKTNESSFSDGKYEIDNNGNTSPCVQPNGSLVNFKYIIDLAYTKPVFFSYYGEQFSEIESWTDLYIQAFRCVFFDHPDSFHEGMSFSKKNKVEFGGARYASQMRSPKSIGVFNEKTMYIEANHSTNSIVMRIKLFLDICHIDYSKVIIKYISTRDRQGGRIITADADKASDPVIELLSKRKLEYIDKRDKQGCLWIVDEKRASDVIRILKDSGVRLFYTKSGGSATSGRAAYWTKQDTRSISIINMNDSFSQNDKNESDDNHKQIYQKLYSISRVYDDPSGITISKILSLLGAETDEKLVIEILDSVSWATKISSDTYSFSENPVTTHNQMSISNDKNTDPVVTASVFYDYLLKERKLSESTCQGYVSAVRRSERYAKENGFSPYEIFDNNASIAIQVIHALLDDEEFAIFNRYNNRRFSAAFDKLIDFAGQTVLFSPGQVTKHITAPKEEPTDFDKNRFVQTLLYRYRNGMQFDSIDFEIFRESYEMLFDESLTFSDEELTDRLQYCGIFYKDRVFPAEGIIDESTKTKLFAYIDSSFASGKKVLYYKAIFEDLADVFANCFTLSDEDMLRAYIEFVADKGKYYFFSEYMSIEKEVSIDHSAEIEECLLNAGKPMATDEVCHVLSHIPSDQVNRIITTDNRFLRNAKGEYFHENIFEISESEFEQIADIINSFINQNEYAIWTDVWKEINEKMPVFVENNLYLSGLGIRNALSQRFTGKFIFESAVISLLKDRYSMRDIYQLYAKHHPEFSSDDIYNLSKELDTNIYFDALYEVSVRVSHDKFISKNTIHFDVEAIDKAIGSFISKEYIRIREIDSYLAFPNVEYEWNEYLLESFVYSYSKKYVLLNNGFSLHNVAGAVAKKDGAIYAFVDACAAVLADAPISLNKNDALNYPADVNMITRRTYRDLDTAIRKAAQIRALKG